MATVPEVRLVEHRGVSYAAAVMLVPRGEEIRSEGKAHAFYYAIATPGWTHWGYTTTYARAWANVRRATKRHRTRLERENPCTRSLSAP